MTKNLSFSSSGRARSKWVLLPLTMKVSGTIGAAGYLCVDKGDCGVARFGDLLAGGGDLGAVAYQ